MHFLMHIRTALKPYRKLGKNFLFIKKKKNGCRWALRKYANRPHVFVRDRKTGKTFTSAPLIHSYQEDLEKVVQAILETGDNEWTGIKDESEQVTKSSVPTWDEIINICNKDWPLRVKDSTRKTWDCELNNLLKDAFLEILNP